MNLQPVQDTHGQVTQCYGCGDRLKLENALADLDGPAFRAYYCPTCVEKLIEE